MERRKLWEIDAEWQMLIERSVDQETGEVNEADLESLMATEGERNDKVCAWGCWLKDKRCEAAEIDGAAAAIQKQADALKDRAEGLRSQATQSEQGLRRLIGEDEKFSNSQVVVGFHKGRTKVIIDNIDLLPDFCIRRKPAPPPEGNKNAAAAEFKAGREVPGAHLEQQPAKLVIE